MSLYEQPFRGGLLNPADPAPDCLKGPRGKPAGRRYDVYRNNVTVSLIAALRTAFPLVLKLLGRTTFDQIAAQHVRAAPPRSPLMMHYGAEFPAFLEASEPLTHLGYLADCARLDLALRASYHAASAATFDAEILTSDPGSAQLCIAPATQIVRSPWPLYDIWLFNQDVDAPHPGAEAQDVLITRPGFDPVLHPLPAGAADWLGHVAEGMTLDDAFDATLAAHPTFDLTAALTLALSANVFAAPTEKDP